MLGKKQKCQSDTISVHPIRSRLHRIQMHPISLFGLSWENVVHSVYYPNSSFSLETNRIPFSQVPERVDSKDPLHTSTSDGITSNHCLHTPMSQIKKHKTRFVCIGNRTSRHHSNIVVG